MQLSDKEKTKILEHFKNLPIAEQNELCSNSKLTKLANEYNTDITIFAILTGKCKGEWTFKENNARRSLLLERDDGYRRIFEIPKVEFNLKTTIARWSLEDKLEEALNFLLKDKPKNISAEVYQLFLELVEGILNPKPKVKRITKAQLLQQRRDKFIDLAVPYIKTKVSENTFNKLDGEDDFDKVLDWLCKKHNTASEIEVAPAIESMNLFDNK